MVRYNAVDASVVRSIIKSSHPIIEHFCEINNEEFLDSIVLEAYTYAVSGQLLNLVEMTLQEHFKGDALDIVLEQHWEYIVDLDNIVSPDIEILKDEYLISEILNVLLIDGFIVLRYICNDDFSDYPLEDSFYKEYMRGAYDD